MDPYTAQMMIMNQIGQLSGNLVTHIRSLLLALAWVIAGLLVAAIVEYCWTVIARLLRFEKLSRWIGLSKIIHKARPDWSPTILTGQVFFWIILVSFFMQALEKSELIWISDLGTLYYDYLPNGLNALLILIMTVIAAKSFHFIIKLVIDNKTSFLFAGLAAALIFSLGTHGVLITLEFDRYLSIILSALFMAGNIIAITLLWIKRYNQDYFEVIRVPELEEGN